MSSQGNCDVETGSDSWNFRFLACLALLILRCIHNVICLGFSFLLFKKGNYSEFELTWSWGSSRLRKGLYLNTLYISSVQFSHSVVSNSLWRHGLQHARLPCPSSTPGACSNSCSSSWWCHPTISSSVVPFSSCPQSFPASGSYPMSWLFPSGGQTI